MDGTLVNSQEGGNLYKSIFCITSDPDQDYAEVPSLFAVNFSHDVGVEWKLIDPNQNLHVVNYQSENDRYLINQGIQSIRCFYDVRGVHYFIMKYMRESLFDITIFNDNIQEISYQKKIQYNFPGRNVGVPLFPTRYCYYFTKIMSVSKIKSCQLSVPKPIGLYMYGRGALTWKIRGPSSLLLDCKLNVPVHMTYVKFGSGWRKFCNLHNVQDGDVLTFFVAVEPYQILDVIIKYIH